MELKRTVGDAEKTLCRLILALQASDPAWNLCSVDTDGIPGGPGPGKDYGLSEGTCTFCRGRDYAQLLSEFVETCRDRPYSRRFRVPGALRSAADVEDLKTRLELLF